ncbi:hypothetical protein [Chryseobacterium sp.]|uniref:hypothetical protein n=1 Tax=Chryseobacterium sp. TaxID=1871047 RepID=UPI00289C5ACF|nr:hypothetical protein [Chryseobacterium sp.]
MKLFILVFSVIFLFSCQKESNQQQKNTGFKKQENIVLKKDSSINSKKPIGSKESKPEIECKEIKGVMLHGEECLISSTSLEKVYEEIADKSLVTDAEFLLKKLPENEVSEKIGKNGIISITYKPSPDKIDIEMFYEGGITEIHLIKQKKNVKRQIVYNAD